MSPWDPWWVHGDYAETYHGAPADEDETCSTCSTCGGSGVDPPSEGWPRGRPCPDCALTDEEWEAWQDIRNEMNR